MQAYGQLPDYSTLGTIEHVIPQKLDEAWTVYLGEEAEDEHLPTVIDTIGNLCLLSGPANSAVGQNPFGSQRGGLFLGHSTLLGRSRNTIQDGIWPQFEIARKSWRRKLTEFGRGQTCDDEALAGIAEVTHKTTQNQSGSYTRYRPAGWRRGRRYF